MKFPNKRALQQNAFNLSPEIDFQDFMCLHKKSTTDPFCFLVIDTAPSSDNSSHFKKNLLETLQKLILAIDDIIKDEKL